MATSNRLLHTPVCKKNLYQYFPLQLLSHTALYKTKEQSLHLNELLYSV